MNHRLLRAAALPLSALLLGSAHAQTTLKVATVSPLSGAQSDMGLQLRNGAQLALNEAKAQFKKLGFDLQLVAYDDQADPTTGTAAARKIVSDKSVLAVVGTLNSGVAIPVSSVLAASHVAMVSPLNTANEVTDRGLKNVNRIVARVDAQGPAAATFMMKAFKVKTVYVLNDKTTFGEGLADEVERALKAAGVQVLANEGTEEKSDFSSIIAKIKLQRPDAIYFGGMYSQAGVFARQLREAGILTPIVGGDGFDSTELRTIAGPGAERIYFTTIAAPPESLAAAKTLAAQYQKAFGRPLQGFGLFSYDATKVALQGILSAIRNQGNTRPTREQVEQAIRKGTVTGLISGTVSFNSLGDRREVKLYILQVAHKAFTLETTINVVSKRP
ncbi:branched-chain amino acid ABC transporter substrate-binding protein (plasmid) [Deinococcus taeanensis]|uniref:branched-chain amino acid ABC transporter substrate-binding protein n=1 Tax=Deinococcus taeanensis TaxID=2737050 RepID=UPI001CDCF217|nr:branched-chain amino acid ABC transporter substrate-binding protein [Deinococcus taeanensis]UBV44635.1 branched-chain amino acid ABC transporter substrate-binding protein [Deinococcus taeanensis]